MLQLDKFLIVAIFKINEEKNNEYIIFVATNVYGMDINNLDIRFVI